MMIHLDLFSGIGGFAYAADQVWDDVEHIFCDNDKFCRAVLKKHWPESEIIDDIRLITDTQDERVERVGGSESGDPIANRQVDILTGGFPCQPFSAAGKRRGTEDNRFLWPEMLRVIRLTKPTWVIAENVRGLLTIEQGVVFEQVCTDLEASGYEVQPLIIPAVAVNAPHRRDRIWFVARNTEHDGKPRAKEAREDSGSQSEESPRTKLAVDERQRDGGLRTKDTGGEATADSKHARLERRSKESQRHSRQQDRNGSDERWDWSSNWLEVAAELCSVDDGLPAELGDFTLTKAGHRKEQLKAYGNSIVPQIAVEIMRGLE